MHVRTRVLLEHTRTAERGGSEVCPQPTMVLTLRTARRSLAPCLKYARASYSTRPQVLLMDEVQLAKKDLERLTAHTELLVCDETQQAF